MLVGGVLSMATLVDLRNGLRRYFRSGLYRRVLPYVRPHKVPMAIVMAIVTVQRAFALLDPWPMKIIIDNGMNRQPLPAWLTGHVRFLASASGYAIVVYAILGGILLKVFGDALGLWRDWLKARVNRSMSLTFKSEMFHHLQQLSFKYHDQTSVGDSIYRLHNDTGWINPLVWGHSRYLFTSSLSLIATLWIVFRLDWQIALLSLAAAPIYYPTVVWANKFFKERIKRQRRMESACETIAQEVLSCLRVVKAFGQEDRERKRFESQSWEALHSQRRLDIEQSMFWSAVSWITRINSQVILVLGAFHVLDGRLTLGELMVILAYVGGIHGPLEEIGHELGEIQSTIISAERSLEVLDTPIEIQDRPGARAIARVEGAVTFEDVCFAYNQDREVLHSIGFTARPGEVTAIVGPTGAGKTTLCNLLVRFYDPTSGRVTLDGHDLRDLTVRTLRDNIALVLQEPILFTGTLRENISYGRLDATMDEVKAAARAANADEFISALPKGYDTQVGERGVRLSGGERQRIAVARAFLKDSPVLILDEPTSSVDSRTEAVILEALDRLMIGRTTFIIAHRLSTVRYSDRIVVMDKGRIVERGTHEELLAQKNLYSELYRIQTGGLRQRRGTQEDKAVAVEGRG